ncbi:MAG: hypothetical protein ACREM6_01030 [Vulcanimicrobiaceae bacterium]
MHQVAAEIENDVGRREAAGQFAAERKPQIFAGRDDPRAAK